MAKSVTDLGTFADLSDGIRATQASWAKGVESVMKDSLIPVTYIAVVRPDHGKCGAMIIPCSGIPDEICLGVLMTLHRPQGIIVMVHGVKKEHLLGGKERRKELLGWLEDQCLRNLEKLRSQFGGDLGGKMGAMVSSPGGSH